MFNQLILVVDDNEDIRDLISLILTDAGFSVLSAADGESAITLALEKEPDLILLDVMLPGKSGILALQEIRSQESTYVNPIPIIMISAKSQSDDIASALSAGATSYIIKPFRAEDLLHKVREILLIDSVK